jgi:hypothetical protein
MGTKCVTHAKAKIIPINVRPAVIFIIIFYVFIASTGTRLLFLAKRPMKIISSHNVECDEEEKEPRQEQGAEIR